MFELEMQTASQGLIAQHQCLPNLTNAPMADVQVQPGYKTLWKTFLEERRLLYQQNEMFNYI